MPLGHTPVVGTFASFNQHYRERERRRIAVGQFAGIVAFMLVGALLPADLLTGTAPAEAHEIVDLAGALCLGDRAPAARAAVQPRRGRARRPRRAALGAGLADGGHAARRLLRIDVPQRAARQRAA